MEMNNIEERGLREGDLELILNHKLVKEANIEPNMGFGTGVLKDGRVFEFGRANYELEIAIFNKVEDKLPFTSCLKYKTSPLPWSIFPISEISTPHFLAKPKAAPVGSPSL